MSFLRKLFGREDEVVEDVPIKLDIEGRRQQLHLLDQARDALATEMRAEQRMDNPGWRARVIDCSCGTCRTGRGRVRSSSPQVCRRLPSRRTDGSCTTRTGRGMPDM